MTTLLTCCQTALREMGKYQVPSTIVGNTDPTAVRLLALANRTGRTLAQDENWQALLATYTFPTVASTASYALPTDYNDFANLTQWNRTNYTPMRGPVSPIEWQALQSSAIIVGTPFNQFFRIAGGFFVIYPTPTSVQTIAYDYYSKNWISGKTEFSDDADVPLIDADLITLGIRWRFLQALGDEFASEKDEFDRRKDSILASDGGRNAIRFWRPTMGIHLGNLPEQGYGS